MRAASLLLAVAVAACAAPQAKPAGAMRHYACDDGSRFVASFGNDAVTITLPQGRITLPRAWHSGALRYAASGVSFRDLGTDARLHLPGRPATRCRGA